MSKEAKPEKTKSSKPKDLEEIIYPKVGLAIPEGWTTIERYPLESAFAYANIIQDPSRMTQMYYVDEVPLTEDEAIVYTRLVHALENELTVPRKSIEPKQYFEEQANRIALKYSWKIAKLAWSKILYFADRDIVGFGALDGLMKDRGIEDIAIDGTARPVFIYHSKHERLPTNLQFDKREELNNLISRFAHLSGKHVSVAYPVVQGSLPGGHRMLGTYMTEVSPHGSTLSIRKFKEDPITIIYMLNFGVLDYKMAAYAWLVAQNRRASIVVGSTGAGKTTLLNSLLTLTRTNTKIITIEEVPEINLAHPNWTALVSREKYGATAEGPDEIGLFDLVKASMRMRPDVIVVGEVRGEEAYVLFQAISTGHGGLCTLHADDVSSAIQRLVSKPMDVPPAFIPFLDVVYTTRRVSIELPDGSFRTGRRVVAVDEISEVGKYTRMFEWNPTKDVFDASPIKDSKKLTKLARDLRLSLNEIEEEIEGRALVLKWMQKKGIRNFREITSMLDAYVVSPNDVYTRAASELGSRALESTSQIVST